MTHPIIRIHVRDFGTMTAELYPEKAPKTVENFVNLAKEGFFEGLIFHRVISGFMIQGGGFTPDFEHKEAKSIKGEFRSNGFAQNDIPHKRGVLSMARTMVKDSASSQFFIMHADAPYLDGEYAAFGKVFEGIEIVDTIAKSKTGSYGYYQDVPKEAVIIEKMSVEE